MTNKAAMYLESSFLKDLLLDENITDISYNGEKIFYVDNQKGRIKSNLNLKNEDAIDFVRQIANFTEKQFSFIEPILDVTFGKYRFNAIHQSIGRKQNEKVINFSIRIASTKNRIINDNNFMDENMKNYLLDILNKNESIMIGGETGSGKTELQKYLLMNLKENSRVIIIDNLDELDAIRSDSNIDLNCWQVSKTNLKSFNDLIENALRCNPDWLIVSEARGKEMAPLLVSTMSGHPLISTIHAYDVSQIPNRITRLIMLNDKNQEYDQIFNDVVSHIFNYVYVKKYIGKDGHIIRYISDIAKYDKNKNKIEILFHKERRN